MPMAQDVKVTIQPPGGRVDIPASVFEGRPWAEVARIVDGTIDGVRDFLPVSVHGALTVAFEQSFAFTLASAQGSAFLATLAAWARTRRVRHVVRRFALEDDTVPPPAVRISWGDA